MLNGLINNKLHSRVMTQSASLSGGSLQIFDAQAFTRHFFNTRKFFQCGPGGVLHNDGQGSLLQKKLNF